MDISYFQSQIDKGFIFGDGSTSEFDGYGQNGISLHTSSVNEILHVGYDWSGDFDEDGDWVLKHKFNYNEKILINEDSFLELNQSFCRTD